MSNRPNRIFVHCSATSDFDDSIDAAKIDSWHKARGWDGIGYHYVIKRNGTIEVGRDENEIGAHARGYNTDSIGICLVGTLNFTSQQVASLVDLIIDVMNRYNIDSTNLWGHYEVNPNKTCPNIPGEILRKLIENELSSRKAYHLPSGAF